MKQNKVILVAQGDDAAYATISQTLEKTALGSTIVRLGSGAELVDFLFTGSSGKRLVPNVAYVLILDENCSALDGEDILPMMEKDKLLARMPVIVLIGSEDEKKVCRYESAGASICILRPAAQDALADTIEKLGAFLAVIQAPQL
jgi:DNA-binding NarL/FixJ family response regulator